jgi:hypothetical protein
VWTEAAPLLPGEVSGQAHNFCDNAVDWLSFSADANTVYTFTTASWGERADTFLALVDTDGRGIISANDDYAGTTDYSSRIVWKASTDDTYYLRVSNRANLTGCATDYSVWVESTEVAQTRIYLPIIQRHYGASPSVGTKAVSSPTGVIRHVCPDGYELDDTWQLAKPIEPDAPQIHSFDSDPSSSAADKDFVWFDAVSGTTLSFVVAPVTNTITLLELYDENGLAVGVTGDSQLVFTPATAGRFYLSISPLTTTFGCADSVGYGLSMQQEAMFRLYLPLIRKD